jgi:hypothetical protein
MKELFALRTKLDIPVIKHRAEYVRAVEKGKAGCGNKDATTEISKLWKLNQTVLVADKIKLKEKKVHEEHRLPSGRNRPVDVGAQSRQAYREREQGEQQAFQTP